MLGSPGRRKYECSECARPRRPCVPRPSGPGRRPGHRRCAGALRPGAAPEDVDLDTSRSSKSTSNSRASDMLHSCISDLRPTGEGLPDELDWVNAQTNRLFHGVVEDPPRQEVDSLHRQFGHHDRRLVLGHLDLLRAQDHPRRHLGDARRQRHRDVAVVSPEPTVGVGQARDRAPSRKRSSRTGRSPSPASPSARSALHRARRGSRPPLEPSPQHGLVAFTNLVCFAIFWVLKLVVFNRIFRFDKLKVIDEEFVAEEFSAIPDSAARPDLDRLSRRLGRAERGPRH